LLARRAVVHTLAPEEEVSGFALALILNGSVGVMPTIVDFACARAAKGDIVPAQCSLREVIPLRLVAASEDTRVATWDERVLTAALSDCPWVVDELRLSADRFQALSGVSVGPMGDRLDDMLRAMVTDRCQIKLLLAGEEIVKKGKPVGGMYILGGGRIELLDANGAVKEELGPGDFLFAAQILAGGGAPASARAGEGGALVLFADRLTAHELLVSVPPLLEIFAS
jgi:CRP-like cAMP-binding protein